MEKIKKNIDLKELEKYGYEKESGMYVKHTNDTVFGGHVVVTINAYTKIIDVCYCWTCFSKKSYFSHPLYSTIMINGEPVEPEKYIIDLIKAGYVEDYE